jgi:hypothetical protein
MSNDVQPQANSSLPDGDALLNEALDKMKGTPAPLETAEASESQDLGDGEKEQKAATAPGFVNVDDPKIKERIDYLWRKERQSEERNELLVRELKKVTDRLAEQESKREKQEREHEKVKDKTAIDHIKAQIKQAMEIGDDDRVSDLYESLADAKAEQKLRDAEYLRNEKEKKVEKPTNTPDQIFTQSDVEYVGYLQSETDDNGVQKRPWLNEDSPDNERAVKEGDRIYKDLYNSLGRKPTIYQVMKELDKAMSGSAKQQPKTQAVLSGNNSASPRTANAPLSEAERRIAHKLRLGKTDAESEKLYAEQVRLLKRK